MVWTVWPLSPPYNHHWSPVSPCRADLIDSTDPTWPVVVSYLRTYFVVNTTSDVRYLVCSLFLFLLLCFWYEHRRFCSIEKVMEEMVFSCLKNTFLHHINCETKWPERKRKDRKLRVKTENSLGISGPQYQAMMRMNAVSHQCHQSQGCGPG